MATVKQGMLVKSRQWWKHLKDYKRRFWHDQRRAEKKDTKQRVDE